MPRREPLSPAIERAIKAQERERRLDFGKPSVHSRGKKLGKGFKIVR
jgi:hypothetical protein